MQDDLTIPSPTYRVPRHSHGMDPGTRKLAMIAAGIGCGLMALAVGWHELGHVRHGVPVVEAEPGPVRVKPLNPGGLQVAGVGNDIFSGGSDTDVNKLAPGPQTPDPAALQAMAAPPPAAATAASAPASAAAPPVPPAAEPASPQSRTMTETRPDKDAVAPTAASREPPATLRDHPTTAHEPPATAREQAVAAARDHGQAVPRAADARPGRSAAPVAEASARSPAGKAVMVQLGALASEQSAREAWTRLAHRLPDLLGHRQPVVSEVSVHGHVLWRLRTGGFDDAAAATAFCRRLRASRADCSVADF